MDKKENFDFLKFCESLDIETLKEHDKACLWLLKQFQSENLKNETMKQLGTIRKVIKQKEKILWV